MEKKYCINMPNASQQMLQPLENACEDDTKQFISSIYHNMPPGYILIWSKGDKKISTWHDTIQGAIEQAKVDKDTSDVYVGCGLSPTPRRANERCPASNIMGIPGVWIDIDFATDGEKIHKKKNLPETREKAMEILDTYPIKPTILINSGHGFQAWWIFEKFLVFKDEQARNEGALLVQTFNNALRDMARSMGYEIDATHDLARVMRVPGTINHKDKKNKVPVNTVHCGDKFIEYQTFVDTVKDYRNQIPHTAAIKPERPPAMFIDTEDFVLNPETMPPKNKLSPSTTGDRKERLEEALLSNNGAEIKRLCDGDFSAYPSHSEADLKLCSHFAFWFGGDREAIDAAFRESGLYRPKWDEIHHSDKRTYGAGTIELAIKGCQNFYKGPEEKSPAVSITWPERLDEAALQSVAGEWVQRVLPNTEADEAALLFQFLGAFGNIVGRGPYFQVEATKHHCNEFLALIGRTAGGRKGTSFDHVKRLAAMIDETWASRNIKSGLTSGEGLIFHVRDATHSLTNKTSDQGVADKRLLAYEPELASILKIIERETNTLSATVREAWDHGDLRTLAKNSPVTATGAHISIIAHCTKDELRKRLSATESFNGFINRFMLVCVQRSKFLPEGGGTVDLSGILPRIIKALAFSQTVGEMKRDEEAREIWKNVYGHLTRERAGILGGVLSRDAAHVVRLSLIYALLDCSSMIRKEHLLAALACWEYVEASASFIFDSLTGDPMADTIFAAVLAAGEAGVTRTNINDLFQRNKPAARINQALEVLVTMGKVRVEKAETGGRQEERLYTRE